MARSSGGVYSKPAGTTPINGDDIDAPKYNLLLDDITTDLNTPRPIVAGGTGASSAAMARASLGTVVQTSAVDTTAGSLLAVGAFGLGVIGTAPGLTAIDATTTASGTYSYTTGATGTFPSSVVAAEGGVITVERESSTHGYMTLQPTGTTALYYRSLSTTWGAWQVVATTATAMPIATTSAVAGQVRLLFAAISTALVLPSGGTWMYFITAYNSTGQLTSGGVVSVSAGGTTIAPADAAKQYIALVWRTA